MSELLPSIQAGRVREGLLDYLATTFALTDADAQSALRDFLESSESGIFKGPFARLRLPFRPAEPGWEKSISWLPDWFKPYGHQAAAFERLSSLTQPRPQPTLVTTGTGSGKTEAFLFPILDHVRRARVSGETGTKALILYPMNALANDQAKRLTQLLTQESALAGITAAIYTGENSGNRSVVSERGLITDRDVIRSNPPDILLTNYKMLDQLLLRPADQKIWAGSAHSLQYLVLDEFHTYDGAQGTDVAMLLRRLGLTLRNYLDDEGAAEFDSRPLGRITPIATSATLGDKGDPDVMLGFAETVFGEAFRHDAVVTESRMSFDEWAREAQADATSAAPATDLTAESIHGAVKDWRSSASVNEADTLARSVIKHLSGNSHLDESSAPAVLRARLVSIPLVRDLVAAASEATSISDLARAVLPGEPPASARSEDWQATTEEFLLYVFAAISHVRTVCGRGRLPMLNVDLHLWVRELSRIDRLASAHPSFRWTDDGAAALSDSAGIDDEAGRPAFPALYCRHCGRSGWGITLTPTGLTVEDDASAVRRKHLNKEGRFRALMYAPAEADAAEFKGTAVPGLMHWRVHDHEITAAPPAPDDEAVRDGWVLPVLTQTSDDADQESNNDTCPSCGGKDGIRFLGSAIATLLSVSMSTLFGDAKLDTREKKALVFTDSVQDAAHRAGFVETRSHSLTLRSLLMDAVPSDGTITLDELAARVIEQAGDDAIARYRILPPDLVSHDLFREFWTAPTLAKVPSRVRERVRQRLAFDAVLEFGLQSRVGRTLELTGAVVGHVDAGDAGRLARVARKALEGSDVQLLGDIDDAALAQWARGVLVHIRQQGGLHHPWLDKYLAEDGNRWRIWGGRPKNKGMPAFPQGRPAPEFPRVGKQRSGTKNSNLVNVTSPQSWYSRWAQRALQVPGPVAAVLARQLLAALADAEVLSASAVLDSGAAVYALPPARVKLTRVSDVALESGETLLTCDVCSNVVPGAPEAVAQLEGAPCMVIRCPGTLRRRPQGANFYRSFYADAAMRRVVAREHTSLLDDKERLEFETGFKESGTRPDAPNVLVATPTLEMGIDIGDLSTVFLSSLPRSVASYLQRVGRAGRLTGNALNLAFVTGRGEQLPRLEDPLSVINGEVRPPATYLDAEEILQRQYLAHLADALARNTTIQHPTLASATLNRCEPGTYLGSLIDFAEADASGHVDRFLGTFAGLAEATREALARWATPSDGPGTSGIAALIYAASQRWTTTLESLEHRLAAILKEIPELDRIAALPKPTEAQIRDARMAHGSLKMVNAQIGAMKQQWWVAALEEYGILPNYTLLDDSVELDIALTWVDENDQFQAAPMSYSRGSRSALSEFAPGSVFYAGGMEITIDAVDLGVDGTSIRTLALCGECGYTVDATDGEAVTHCPRCGDTSIADVSQRVDSLEFTRASAEVRRDEHRISDRTDDRQRTRFSVLAAPDIDPGYESGSWYVQDYDFGARYFSKLDIRWLNMGKADAQGTSLMASGREVSAAMFAVCEGCGKQDSHAGANNPWEHRTWCRYRNDRAEHHRKVVLTRTLSTQGVLLRLPKSVTLGDDFALPSLKAAILLGLREEFGGAPDHIDVIETVDPQSGADGGNPVPSLLLHDVVPGGTGYLADLRNPEKVWSLLRRAWALLDACKCQDGDRHACHRCLLPFARGHEVASTSRAAAAMHLRAMLASGKPSNAEPGADVAWSTTSTPPAKLDTESHLEQAFRAALVEALESASAKVVSVPGPHGPKLRITFPAGKRTWILEPQVMMHGSKPDFVLSSTNPNDGQLAVFTDGFTYHATKLHNRVADDAQKRAALRAQGVKVIAVTAPDIDEWSAQAVVQPTWMTEQLTNHLMLRGASFSAEDVNAVADGPIALLVSWMREPRLDQRRSFADQAPYYFVNEAATTRYRADPDSPLETVLAAALQGQSAPVESDPKSRWMWRHGACGLNAEVESTDLLRIVVAIDDRDATVEDSATFKTAWREWLRLSNLFGMRDHSTMITALSSMSHGTPEPEAAPSATPSDSLDEEWQEVLGYCETDTERAVVTAASAVPGATPPELGHEVLGGATTIIAWPDLKVAVDAGLDPDVSERLQNEGWTVVAADANAMAAVLSEGVKK
ncbi:DEAD/DEAH box helicase [Demequina sediminicola]|uniref:DEAD/DEAH box helicase n=1 Tax=Demequina sediminicola TaxID=1095026 RepID=UPI00078614E9|nr:DEAD/DEAH box helicase [Demequina sediminicola]